VSSPSTAAEKANPRSLPQPLTSICLGLALLGVGAFLYGLRSDPQTAWLAFHTNFIYFATLSQAGLIMAAIFVIVGAKWPGPYRRLAEGLAAWVPVTLVLSIIGYFGGDYLFEWLREGAIHGKEPWLNATRFYVTDIGLLAVLTLLTLMFLKTSARPTLNNLNSGSSFAQNMAKSWTSGWKGDEEERAASKKKLEFISPIICLIFAFGYSVIAFDQVMSMEQSWFSNLFGAWVTWGGILSAVAAMALLSVLHMRSPGLEGHITESRRHDIGKLLFAFSTFWMYLFWAQYLVIWYGNLPEETQFLFNRLGPQFLIDKGQSAAAFAAAWGPWDWDWARLSQNHGWHSMVVWLCCWIVPFAVLMGQKPKKTPWILGPVAAVVLFGLWCERNLLIWPSVVKEDSWLWLSALPICIGLGFLGAFALVFLVYTRVFPSLAVPDEG